MPEEQYTHNFKFEVGEDGSKFIRGQVEFNIDDKISYKIESTSEPFPHELLGLFTKLMDVMKEIFKTTEGIKLIKVAKKE